MTIMLSLFLSDPTILTPTAWLRLALLPLMWLSWLASSLIPSPVPPPPQQTLPVAVRPFR